MRARPPALYRLTQKAACAAAEPRAVNFVVIRFRFFLRLAGGSRFDARKVRRLVFVLRVFKRTKLLQKLCARGGTRRAARHFLYLLGTFFKACGIFCALFDPLLDLNGQSVTKIKPRLFSEHKLSPLRRVRVCIIIRYESAQRVMTKTVVSRTVSVRFLFRPRQIASEYSYL